METIKTAIWGNNQNEQSGQEPISGERGSEAYDAGNETGDTSLSGRSAQESNELGSASNDHGPHSTYAGNMLDPRTGDKAHQQTFGSSGDSYTESRSDNNRSGSGIGSTDYSSNERSGDTYNNNDRSASNFDGSNERSIGDYDRSSSNITGTNDRSTGDYDRSSSNLTGTNDRSTNDYDRSNDRSTSDYDNSTTGDRSRSGYSGDSNTQDRSSDTSGRAFDGSSGNNTGVNSSGSVRPEHETDKTGVKSFHSNDPHGSDVRPSEADENTANKNVGGFGTAEPSVGAKPESGAAPKTKQQGAGAPLDEPDNEQTSAIRGQKEKAEGQQDKSGDQQEFQHDPDDHSGEPLKMHNIDEERKQSIAGQPGGNKRGEEKGTGQEWIKTSGMAADGGDFDATKAGAGQEANRLLEEKGIHKEKGDSPNDIVHDDPSGTSEGKVSGITKLKEKLHIGSKKE